MRGQTILIADDEPMAPDVVERRDRFRHLSPRNLLLSRGMFRRSLFASLLATLLVVPAFGQVKLVVRDDGTKSIFNLATKRSSTPRTIDYEWLAKQHDRETMYDEAIRRHSTKYGVDPRLVKAVIQVESAFNPEAVSYKGARGLMQLMPGTAKRFGVKNVYDVDENIRAGCEYLALLIKLFANDLTRVLAGYNAGENAVVRYRGVPPYEETQLYVQKALTVYHGRPYGGVVVGRSGRISGNPVPPGAIKLSDGRTTGGSKLGGGFKSEAATTLRTTSSMKLGKASESATPVALGSM